MKVLVFGESGQVAASLAGRAGVTCLPRSAVDLCDADACAAAISVARPEAVINAAAYTAVDAAETDAETAFAVNAAAPEAMARACAELGVPFVHISTDYVFDGSGEAPWRPGDGTGPLQVYGESKLEGEARIAAIGRIWTVLRTSWVFSATGSNFVKTMLRLSQSHEHLRIVSDQIGGPTPAEAIAEACMTIVRETAARSEGGGLQHFSGAPDVSWAGFARAIFEIAGREVAVEDIPTSEYPTPAARPLNSRLDCSALEQRFGLARPDWRVSLGQVIESEGQGA